MEARLGRLGDTPILLVFFHTNLRKMHLNILKNFSFYSVLTGLEDISILDIDHFYFLFFSF